MTAFDIRLFGAIEIRRNGELLTGFRSQKALVLLVYLLCEQRPVAREYLAGLGWPESDQSQALGLLRRSLHDLQQQLPGCLAVDNRTVRFSPTAPVTADLQRFVVLAAQDEPDAWSQAVALYRAPFLQGIYLADAPELENWLVREQERWQGEVVRLLSRLIAYHTERAAYQPALDYTQKLLAVEPWREEAHRQAMLLLARLGQTSAALAQYERCRQVLQAELAVAPAQETERLRTRIAAIAHQPTHPLPPATTPFIGRSEEVGELTQWLAGPHNRLITLVGPGGMGKTRLALAVAHHVVTEQRRIFLHGVVFVPLVGVETLPQTVAALAQALAFPLQSQGVPEIQLLHYLRDKEVLLVLDNVEQLVSEPILAFVRQLLDGAPDLKLLVTSRVRLNLQAEQLYWMQGLSVPVTAATTAPLPVAEITTYSGVQLFLSTVQRSRPHYTLSTSDVSAVVAICQLVQGMPLALELAATWMSVLTPAEIAAELTRNLDFLASDLHDLPLRQRSMRAVFATSWRLLTAGEQQIFAQLSVFRGSFTREAAQAVTGASLPVLVRLIHTSFLQQSAAGRYQIHELLRQFGEEQLAYAPDMETAVHKQHSVYYCHWLMLQEVNLKGSRQQEAMKEIDANIQNIRIAWNWSVTHAQVKSVEEALESLLCFYEWRGFSHEGEAICRQSVEKIYTSTSPHTLYVVARLLVWQGIFCRNLGNNAQGEQLVRQSLAILDSLHIANVETRSGKAFAFLQMGYFANRHEAKEFRTQSLNYYRSVNDEWGSATALYLLGQAVQMLGDYIKAESYFQESLIIQQKLGNRRGIALALRSLGYVALDQGQEELAEQLVRKSLAIIQQSENRAEIAYTLHSLAVVLTRLGKFNDSLLTIEQSIDLYEDQGSYWADVLRQVYASHIILHLGRYSSTASLVNSDQIKLGNPFTFGHILITRAMLALVAKNYAQAQAIAQESIAIWQKNGHLLFIGQSFALLGYAACELGNLVLSQQAFSQALEVGVKHKIVLPILYALPGVALLWTKQYRDEQAVELYALVSRHAHIANSYWFAETVKPVSLSADTIAVEALMPANVSGCQRELWEAASKALTILQQ